MASLPDTIDLTTLTSGRWAVAVSGGADSVSLLLLVVRALPISSIHVVHLDHETRDGESGIDAQFVRELAKRLKVHCTIVTRSFVESSLDRIESNTSARFRTARLHFFERVVSEHQLDGVILAHHADDQAETVLHRILRGTSIVAGLAGMSPRTRVGPLLIVRPLLSVRRATLRQFLQESAQSWREDVSNGSDAYLRNRLRRLLSTRPRLTESLLNLSASCRAARDWLREHTPVEKASLRSADLLALALPQQRELARRWLVAAGVPKDRVDPQVIGQLIQMAMDAATPPRLHFPGKLLVRRTKGSFTAIHPPANENLRMKNEKHAMKNAE